MNFKGDWRPLGFSKRLLSQSTRCGDFWRPIMSLSFPSVTGGPYRSFYHLWVRVFTVNFKGYWRLLKGFSGPPRGFFLGPSELGIFDYFSFRVQNSFVKKIQKPRNFAKKSISSGVRQRTGRLINVRSVGAVAMCYNALIPLCFDCCLVLIFGPRRGSLQDLESLSIWVSLWMRRSLFGATLWAIPWFHVHEKRATLTYNAIGVGISITALSIARLVLQTH